MSGFKGYQCDGDGCENVMTREQRTKVTVRYDGPYVSGTYDEDLCRECVQVPAGVELKPLRRQSSNGQADERDEAGVAPGVG
jgi:NAD(P)H-flavin reductase